MIGAVKRKARPLKKAETQSLILLKRSNCKNLDKLEELTQGSQKSKTSRKGLRVGPLSREVSFNLKTKKILLSK